MLNNYYDQRKEFKENIEKRFEEEYKY